MKKTYKKDILEKFSKSGFQFNGKPVDFGRFLKYNFIIHPRRLSNEFSRLKREGYLEKEGESLRITRKGQEYVKRKQDNLSVFDFKFPKESPKNMIVMFDIPEGKKAEREWFRFHLKKFGYIMVQRSVWVGPSPLPKDFLDYLKEIKLKECIKTFKLAKPYKNKELS